MLLTEGLTVDFKVHWPYTVRKTVRKNKPCRWQVGRLVKTGHLVLPEDTFHKNKDSLPKKEGDPTQRHIVTSTTDEWRSVPSLRPRSSYPCLRLVSPFRPRKTVLGEKESWPTIRSSFQVMLNTMKLGFSRINDTDEGGWTVGGEIVVKTRSTSRISSPIPWWGRKREEGG